MRRRDFIGVVAGSAVSAAPIAARAQQPTRKVGVLMPYDESDTEAQTRALVLRDELRKLGWIEGRNLHFDFRWTSGDQLQSSAAELVAMSPDVLFGSGTPVTAVLQRATRTIPIVFAQVVDPIFNGFVATLARPGGNITGFALYEQAIIVKRLELLKQIAPHVTRVMFVYDPASPSWVGFLAQLEIAAPSFGVKVSGAAVRDSAEIERAIEGFAREPNGGLLMLASPAVNIHRELITVLARRYRLPDVYPFRFFAAGGGLASYGADNIDSHRRAASYVARILNGEKPGDLPVQQADKYELVINLKTAKVLSLEIPIALLARTDEVIE